MVNGEWVNRMALRLKQTVRPYQCTIGVSLSALLIWAIPGAGSWFELDYQRVAEGQWWRIWTGHLTHFDGNHLFWDLLMFVGLGAACERIQPRHFPFALAAMMVGVTASVGWWCDEIRCYRGLSGIDTGLFVWFVSHQCQVYWARNQRWMLLLGSIALLGLISKLVFEAMTGQTLFVDSSGFTPLVESHLAGAACGLGCSVDGLRDWWVGAESGFSRRPPQDGKSRRVRVPRASLVHFVPKSGNTEPRRA